MEAVVNIFPMHLRKFVQAGFALPQPPEEIRIRLGQPVMLDTGSRELFWDYEGEKLQESPELAYRITEKDVRDMIAYMSNYSLYAFEEELRAGFLTIQGGHRVGIAGKAVCENGKICTIRQISFLNIRIAREKRGCADAVMPHIRNGQSIYNTLLISPPGAGKTTLLRDCVRQLSSGDNTFAGLKVGVIDERSEIAACYLGKPQNDLGPRTDVMDCCPKAEGILRLLRAMSPQVICVDELGGKNDYEAVAYALHCGCRLMGTIHGENLAEMQNKAHVRQWLEQGFFERYIIIKKKGKNREFEVYNERLARIC